MNEPGSPVSDPPSRQYTWPWFAGIAVVLAVVLAFLWMRHEVNRTRRIRDANLPEVTATNFPQPTR